MDADGFTPTGRVFDDGGNLIETGLDSGEFKPTGRIFDEAGNLVEEQTASFLDSVKRGAANILPSFESAAAGIGGMVGAGMGKLANFERDYGGFGTGNMLDMIGNAFDKGSNYIRGSANDWIERNQATYGNNLPAGFAGSIVEQGVPMVAKLAPALASGPFAPAVMGLTAAGDEFSNLRNQDVSPDQAFNAAGTTGLINAVASKPLAAAVQAPTASILGRVLKGGAWDALTNSVTEAGRMGSENYFTPIENSPTDMALGTAKAAGLGFLTGGAAAGLAHPVIKAREAKILEGLNQDLTDIPAIVKEQVKQAEWADSAKANAEKAIAKADEAIQTAQVEPVIKVSEAEALPKPIEAKVEDAKAEAKAEPYQSPKPIEEPTKAVNEDLVDVPAAPTPLLSNESGFAPIISDAATYVSGKAKEATEAMRDYVEILQGKHPGVYIGESEIDKAFTKWLPRGVMNIVDSMQDLDRKFGGMKGGEGIRLTWKSADENLGKRRSQILFDSGEALESLTKLNREESRRAGVMANAIRRESAQRIEAAQAKLSELEASPEFADMPEAAQAQARQDIIDTAHLPVDEKTLIAKGLNQNEAKAVVDTLNYNNKIAPQFLREAWNAVADRLNPEPSKKVYALAKKEVEARAELKAKLKEATDKAEKEEIQQRLKDQLRPNTEAINEWRKKKAEGYALVNKEIVDLTEWNGVQKHYVPFQREGNFWLKIKDKDGNVQSVHLTDKLSAYRGAKDAIAKGLQAESGPLKKTEAEAYDQLPLNSKRPNAFRNPVNETGYPGLDPMDPLGFGQHLRAAKLIEGESDDLVSSMSKYVAQLANFTSKSNAKRDFAQALRLTDNTSKVFSTLAKYHDRALNSAPSYWSKYNKAIALWNLAGRTSSAAINLTQTITTTTAQVGTKNSMKAFKLGGEYLALGKDGFAKKYPHLADTIRNLKRDGTLDAAVVAEWDNAALRQQGLRGGAYAGHTLSEISMLGFTKAEQFNRLHAALAGYLDAADKRVAPAEQLNYIRKFVNDTQFNQNMYAKPLAGMSGPGQSAMLFRTWGINYLKFLGKLAKEDKKALSRAVFFMWAGAGLSGTPGSNWIMKSLESAGYDPKRAIKDLLGDSGGELALYGAMPYLTGVNMSAALGLGNTLPDVSGDKTDAIIKAVGGVGVDPLFKLEKVMNLAAQGHSLNPFQILDDKNPRSALEPMMPSSVGRMVEAARLKKEGLRKPDGSPMGHAEKGGFPYQPTTSELVKTALGFNPVNISKRYDEEHSKMVQTEAAKGYRQNINNTLAEIKYDIKTGKATFKDLQKAAKDFNESQKGIPPRFRQKIDMGTVDRLYKKRLGIDTTSPKALRAEMIKIREEYSND